MRILLASSGSYGDLYPFIALGREAQARGHEVILFVGAHFEPLVAESGLSVVPIGSPEMYDEIVRHPDAFHPRRGFRLIAGANMAFVPEVYRKMQERVVAGETLIVASTLSFGARLLRETHGVPTAAAHLAPSIFRSAEKPPKLGERGFPDWVPAGVYRFVFRAVDALVIDRVFCPELNRFRASLDLPPVKRIFHRWIHEADLVLALFPDWFAEPPSDWPDDVRFTGFPLYDGAVSAALAEDVEGFLDAGSPPVVFTTGTAVANESAFFETSVEACRRAGLRALLLTRYPEQLPRDLPEGVRHFEELPFSQLLPRVAAIVHHGGIGTAGQAMAAGLPQLVRPLAFDQFDNARHLERLGVARTLAPKRYVPGAVVEALRELVGSPSVREACLAAQRRVQGQDGVRTACDVLLGQLVAKTPGPSPLSDRSGTFAPGPPS